MVSLSAIEQAIKDAIAALERSYIAEIKSYGGEFDVSNERDFSEVVRRFPAVWVTFAGSGDPKHVGAGTVLLPLVFTILVGARSVRNEESSRHGAVAQDGKTITVGSFQLLHDVARAIAGQSLGLPITPLTPSKIRVVFNTKTGNEAVSVLSWDFTCRTELNFADFEDEEAAWLEKINIDYLFKPGDDEPDMGSDINLKP